MGVTRCWLATAKCKAARWPFTASARTPRTYRYGQTHTHAQATGVGLKFQSAVRHHDQWQVGPGSNHKIHAMTRISNLTLACLLLIVVASIVVQDLTHYLPDGLFNNSRDLSYYISFAFLVVTVAFLAVLIWHTLNGGLSRTAGLVRAFLVCFIIAELFTTIADRLLVSQNPDAVFGGPHYEVENGDGNWVFLKRPNNISPMGFRTDHPYQREIETRRLLFLGDSFTEGSGSSTACNYPNVAEQVLQESLGDLEVMNAGVSGYGPRDTLNLLGLVQKKGYKFDALVFSVFTENDFTDNLPGTERRIVGGMISRFPQAMILKTFHPMNTHLFRYASILSTLAALPEDDRKRLFRDSDECIQREGPLTEVSPSLRELVLRRLEGSERVLHSESAKRNFTNAVAAMSEEAAKLGIPFVIVLFPDRLLVDKELRALMNIDDEQLGPLKQLHQSLETALAQYPVINVAGELDGQTGMFLPDDTHLSDKGNIVAGSFVAREMVKLYRQKKLW